MKAVVAATPPQELFRELTDLGNLIFSMLTGAHITVKRWPTYYMVYVEFDRLCREIHQTTGYLARGFIEPDGTVSSDRIEGINACLFRVGGHLRTLVDLLARIECHGLVSHGKPALKKIVEQHFSPKSIWYPAFQENYCSGRVSRDGRVLQRHVLFVNPYPPSGAIDIGADLVEPQTFELVSEQSRIHLGRTARSVQARLNQVYAALGDFFVDRCPSVSELLHPWTT